jgi:hypothetical protein
VARVNARIALIVDGLPQAVERVVITIRASDDIMLISSSVLFLELHVCIYAY